MRKPLRLRDDASDRLLVEEAFSYLQDRRIRFDFGPYGVSVLVGDRSYELVDREAYRDGMSINEFVTDIPPSFEFDMVLWRNIPEEESP